MPFDFLSFFKLYFSLEIEIILKLNHLKILILLPYPKMGADK